MHQNELLTCDPMHLGFIKYWLKIEFCIHLQTNTVLQFFLRIYLHYYYHHHHTTTAIIKLQIDITRLIWFFNISTTYICIADLCWRDMHHYMHCLDTSYPLLTRTLHKFHLNKGCYGMLHTPLKCKSNVFNFDISYGFP